MRNYAEQADTRGVDFLVERGLAAIEQEHQQTAARLNALVRQLGDALVGTFREHPGFNMGDTQLEAIQAYNEYRAN